MSIGAVSGAHVAALKVPVQAPVASVARDADGDNDRGAERSTEAAEQTSKPAFVGSLVNTRA